MPAPMRFELLSIKSALVDATMMGSPTVLCVNVPQPNGKSVGCRKERLGGWFIVMLEVNLPREAMVRIDETKLRA